MIAHAHRHSRNAGFTLIEVMITVAVDRDPRRRSRLPSYFDYVTRSQLVEAKTNLADMRTRLEQYFLDNRTYPDACVASAPGPAGAGNIYLPASQKYLHRDVHDPDADDLHGHRHRRRQHGHGFVFTIDQANTRTTTKAPSGWGTSDTCWVSQEERGMLT